MSAQMNIYTHIYARDITSFWGIAGSATPHILGSGTPERTSSISVCSAREVMWSFVL